MHRPTDCGASSVAHKVQAAAGNCESLSSKLELTKSIAAADSSSLSGWTPSLSSGRESGLDSYFLGTLYLQVEGGRGERGPSGPERDGKSDENGWIIYNMRAT